ncbi:uncharacterized protein LOC124327838 isoform X1 [Daphnia pulicaria]|uniref:uncharacterized protein LOC124327838 isoform X1 n=1 Tax=Daphnia pulicaria TaxID=35523 RepID=UPI001EE9DB98|nr:uncharacterized protein LOC124327838 isoform X1 [Daphnia pulicaria]
MKYSVEITGPALSFLYYSVSSSLKEGFLFGTVEEKHIEIISDSSESSVEPETIIRVTGVFPCSLTSKLFSQENDVDIPHQGDSVIIGWFSGRKNSLFKPSFRETALHSKLNIEYCQNHIERFLFVLVQDNPSETSITREFQAKFFQFDKTKRRWSSLTGSILNWNQRSKSSNLANKSLYRSLPTFEPSLLSRFEEETINQGLIGEQFIEGMFTNAHSYLMESMDRIANITSEIAQVEAEIARLRINKEESENNPPSPPIMERRNQRRV